jgi:hypothetical protein
MFMYVYMHIFAPRYTPLHSTTLQSTTLLSTTPRRSAQQRLAQNIHRILHYIPPLHRGDRQLLLHGHRDGGVQLPVKDRQYMCAHHGEEGYARGLEKKTLYL